MSGKYSKIIDKSIFHSSHAFFPVYLIQSRIVCLQKSLFLLKYILFFISYNTGSINILIILIISNSYYRLKSSVLNVFPITLKLRRIEEYIVVKC